MTATQCLGLCGAITVAAGVSGMAAWLAVGSTSPLALAFGRHAKGLNTDLLFVRSNTTGTQVLMWQLLATAALCIAAPFSSPLLLTLLPAVAFAPRLWLKNAREHRVLRVEEQLDGWLLILANALKAVPSIGDALASSCDLVRAPLCEELDVLVKETQLGTPVDDALQNMSKRLGSRVVSAALTAMQVARNTGGDLSATLESSAATLRELARLEGVVRTKTADARNQAMVVGALPGVMMVALNWVHPDILVPLFNTTQGNLLLALAFALWAAAIALSMRILKVDI